MKHLQYTLMPLGMGLALLYLIEWSPNAETLKEGVVISWIFSLAIPILFLAAAGFFILFIVEMLLKLGKLLAQRLSARK
jgi:hypothetical protein